MSEGPTAKEFIPSRPQFTTSVKVHGTQPTATRSGCPRHTTRTDNQIPDDEGKGSSPTSETHPSGSDFPGRRYLADEWSIFHRACAKTDLLKRETETR